MHLSGNLSVLKHFDAIAGSYDKYKQKNSFYYTQLKILYREIIADVSSVSIAELGCGTGEILASLSPKKGLGIDISRNMVRVASSKYNRANLRFIPGSIGDPVFLASAFLGANYDYWIMPDTIEHLTDIDRTFSALSSVISGKTDFIITWVNPLWEPILNLLELLRLKMPEGPHHWPGMNEVTALLKKHRFEVLRKGRRIIMPFHIRFLTSLVNEIAARISLINALCLIQYVVCRKKT